MFGHHAQNSKSDTPVVERIQIPLIQLDYAQGRPGESVDRIRANFLDALHDVITRNNAAISLDFVYGDVKDGTFYPLDGQQRLTTLFLLHWYLAIQGNCLSQAQDWKQFSYATRPGARLFCERIVQYQPPADEECLSAWIKDQAWYLHTWQHDPTIQSMLSYKSYHAPCLHQREKHLNTEFNLLSNSGKTTAMPIVAQTP